MYQRLPPEEKVRLIKRVVAGQKVFDVCREAGISRTIFYRWLKAYQQARTRAKNCALASKIPQGKRHWQSFSPKVEREVLKVALKNPSFSAKKIADAVGVSGNGAWSVLKRHGFNTPEIRTTYIERNGSSLVRPRPLFEKLTLMRRFESGEKVSQLCQEFGISRTLFYRFLKRYQNSQKQIESLENLRPKGERHWKFVPGSESLVKKVVVEHPEYSAQKISEALTAQAGRPILGHTGVHNLLSRHELNTYQKRLVFAKSQAPSTLIQPSTSWVDRPKTVLEGFLPQLAPAPPPSFLKKVGKSLLPPFGLSLFCGLLLFSWLRLFAGQPLSSQIGLLLATVSLTFGFFFFLYSLKYYFTLILILGFSRQVSGGAMENGKLRVENGKKGILERIFGPPTGGLRGSTSHGAEPPQESSRFGGGLQPDLSHVVLERSPFVSIHLPMYNEKRVVDRLLTACTSMEYPSPSADGSGQASYEVVVVDDSTDETQEILKNWQGHPRVKIIHRDSREGFKGGALKEALKITDPRAEFVIVFDADFLPYPDTITQFLKYFQVTAGGLDVGIRNQGEKHPAGVPQAGRQTSQPRLTAAPHHLRGGEGNFSPIAAIQGYQWHVLNKSENWITRGVRSEYAGSYVIERSGEEALGALKQIAGSVYMIRKDILDHYGWGTSITEDFELTLKLYRDGYKVVYTPYIQTPSECVSTLKRLIRQRMRWAEGHSHNIKRRFGQLMWGRWEAFEKSPKRCDLFEVFDRGRTSLVSQRGSSSRSEVEPPKESSKVWIPSKLTLMEKLEFAYLSPYYLQAAFFMIGTISWFLSEAVFKVRLPFWTSLWGWSLVFTNLFSLPLMNTVGLFLEESEERDYGGILSFIVLSYLIVPFQGYAALKGFLEKEEGPWFRTPKTGRITDIFTPGRFARFISAIFPGRRIAGGEALTSNGFSQRFHLASRGGTSQGILALATANNRFNNFRIGKKQARWMGRTFLVSLLIFSTVLLSLAPAAPYFIKPQKALANSTFGMLVEPSGGNRSNLAQGNLLDQEIASQDQKSVQKSALSSKKAPNKTKIDLASSADTNRAKNNQPEKEKIGLEKAKDGEDSRSGSSKKIPSLVGRFLGQASMIRERLASLTTRSEGDEDSIEKIDKKVVKEQQPRKNFRSNEEPELIFQFPREKEEKSLLHRFFNLFKAQASSNDEIRARLFDNSGEEIVTDLVVLKENEGNIKVKVPISSSFKPGAYKLKVELEYEGKVEIQEQDFTWGVLAINTNKSIYLPNEEAYIQMAALKDDGHTICEADLELEVTSPDAVTSKPDIQKSGKCGPDNVTDVPDYFTRFKVSGEGDYQIKLTNRGNGYSINDKFSVRSSVAFDIERNGPTRIYPVAVYKMNFKVKVNEDFAGEIKEVVPKDFQIFPAVNNRSYDEIKEQGEEKIIIWKVSLKKDEKISLGYQFDAPDISPYLYLLGPLKIGSFQEIRQWQMAADAVTPTGVAGFGETAADDNMQFLSYTSPSTYTDLGNSVDVTTETNDIFHVVVKAAPTRDEIMSGQLKAGGLLNITRCIGGCDAAADWSEQLEIAAVTPAQTCDATAGACEQAFDIAYEQLSGRTFVAYGKSANDGIIFYNIYDGNVWTGEASYTFKSGSTADTRWVRLVADGEGLVSRRSNRILLLVEDADSDIFAAIWNGSGFGNLTTITTDASVPNRRPFDGAWETNLGNLVVVYGEGTANSTTPFKYRTFNGSSWDSSGTSVATLTSSIGAWVEMVSDPQSNRLAAALEHFSTAAVATGMFAPVIWKADGSTAGFTLGNVDTSLENPMAKGVAVAWEKYNGGTSFAMFVDADSTVTTDASDYETWTAGAGTGTFSGLTDMPGDGGDDANTWKIYRSPNSDEILAMLVDIDSDLCFQRWSETAWDADCTTTEHSTTLPPDTTANKEMNSLDFAYRMYSPWTGNWRWTDDMTNTNPASWLAAENASPSGIANMSNLRLRVNIWEKGGGGQTDARKKLQFTTNASGCNPNVSEDNCSWSDVGDQGSGSVWRYCDGPGADDTNIPSYVLSGSTAVGPFVENGTLASTYDHTALAVAEWDFCLNNNGATATSSYYFRVWDNDQKGPVFRLQTSGSSYTYPGITPGVTELAYRWRNDYGGETASGWLNGWGYRKWINVDRQSTAGTNYVVKVTANYGSGTDSGANVYLNSRAKGDFGDVRFTDASGSGLLDYWQDQANDERYFAVSPDNENVATAYGIIGSELFWSTPRATATGGYIYKTNLTTQSTTLLYDGNGIAAWQSLVSGGYVYAVGQEYDAGSILRSSLYKIDTNGVTAALRSDTGDINELIGLETDGTYLIAGERGTGGGQTGSSYPNGGGLWKIPISTATDSTTWSRVYEESGKEWVSIAYYEGNSKWYAYVSDYSGRWKIISSSNLTSWSTEIDYSSQTAGSDVRGMIIDAGSNLIVLGPVQSTSSHHMRVYNGSTWSDYDLGIALERRIKGVWQSTVSKVLIFVSDTVTSYRHEVYTINSDGTGKTKRHVWRAGIIEHLQSRASSFLSESDGDYYFPIGGATSTLARIKSINITYADFWVEIPGNLNDSSQTIYIYYGNSSASSASNGDNTFTEFIDGESDESSKFSFVDLYFVGTDATFAYNSSEKSHDLTINAGDGIGLKIANITGSNYEIWGEVKTNATGNRQAGFLMRYSTSGTYYAREAWASGAAVKFAAITKQVSPPSLAESDLVSSNHTEYNVAYAYYKVKSRAFGSSLSANFDMEEKSLSVTNSDYASGEWGLFGGFDALTVINYENIVVRKYVSPEPIVTVRGSEETEAGSSWKQNENIAHTDQAKLENVRLRVLISNSGAPVYNYNYRLRVAAKGGATSCEAVASGNFSDVPTTTSGCGTSVACMTTSGNIVNDSSSVQQLTVPSGFAWSPGKTIEDPSNQTSAMTLNTLGFTEFEYNFQFTNNALGSTAYCFRVTNAGTSLDTYYKVAEITTASFVAVDTVTAWSFQRKTFYDGIRDVYWRFSYDGGNSNIVVEYNTTPWTTSWTATTSLGENTNDFSIWDDNTYIYIAYYDTYDIRVMRGTLATSSISWGTEYPALDGTGASATYQYAYISQDSSGYLWVIGRYYNGTNYYIQAKKSMAANDPSSWEATTYNLSDTTNINANIYGVISSLGSQNMYATWIRGTAIEGKKYTQGTGWDASATAIGTGKSGLASNISMSSDTNNNLHLAYIDGTDYVQYKKYTASWDPSPTRLDTTAINEYVTVSVDSGNNDVYVVYLRSSVAYYKKYSGTWGGETDTGWTEGTSPKYLTSNYSDSGRIFAQWTSGSASPYTLNWNYIIIPEKLWLLLGLGLIVPRLLRRKNGTKANL